MTRRSFASDNAAGAHPEVLAAMARVNEGHVTAYGADEHTARAEALIRNELGDTARPFLVFGGTGANVTALSAVLQPHEAVICAETAHINVDECGAPERHAGAKLIPIVTPDGKLTPELVRPAIKGIGAEHHVQPRVISISQSTEYGTVYTPSELSTLSDFAHNNRLLLHVDGARLANAAAALGVSLKAITADAGVDLLSFGATKNGAVGAEAVVFFREEPAKKFKYIRKQGMQLPSKMRFVAAQFEALLTDELWRRSAAHANAMARRLANGVRGVPGITITQPVEANAVFAILPADRIAQLQEKFFFYVWDEQKHEVRWMTAWDTTEEDVDGFVGAVREVVGRQSTVVDR
jgi:threonine aldolase